MGSKRVIVALFGATLALSACTCGDPNGNDGGKGGDGGFEEEDAGCKPPVPTDPCQIGVCDLDGTARFSPRPDGTVLSNQLVGDCKKKVCIGGNTTDVTDDGDLPLDFSDCTQDVCQSGLAVNPPLANGTRCDGGICNGSGLCVQCSMASDCPGSDTECRVRTCIGGVCGFSYTAAGTPLSVQTAGDCRRVTCNGAGNTVVVNDGADVNDDGNACTFDGCDAGLPVRGNLDAGVSCGAGLACNGSGTCTGCTVPADCGDAGVCKSFACTNGGCFVGDLGNNTPCDDGNLCTQTDTCQAGVCTGANPVVCTALDACHTPGACQPDAGTCTNPLAPDNSSCSDNNLCTLGDRCLSGACVPDAGVTCGAPDQCHDAGVCIPDAGTCTNPPVANSTPCNDGNLCTQTDTCQSGTCTGGGAVVCPAADQCHSAGVCQPDAGTCTNPVLADSTPCNDQNLCTQTDTCQSGVCTGTNPRICTPLDQCHVAGVCIPDAGTCTNPNAPEDAGCNDSNACTLVDRCVNGVCTGASSVVCTAQSQCHQVGTCNPGTGACSNPTQPNNTPCNDSNACTAADTCQGGVCTGGSSVVCTASDQCHLAGTCSPDGGCSNPAAPNNTPCNDSSACTQTDTCQSGVCTGANPVVCTPLSQCFATGTCNPTTGVCSNPFADAGTPCSEDGGTVCNGAGVCFNGPLNSPQQLTASESPVVLSQVYPAGGEIHATWNADYVELHNRGAMPVSLSGWSLQIAAAGDETFTVRTLSGTIPPGGYFLVRLTAPRGGGRALPAPDLTFAGPKLPAAGGRVLLSTQTVPERAPCPSSAAVVDLLSWGESTATCSDGAPLAAPDGVRALVHRFVKCAAATPRNSTMLMGAGWRGSCDD